MGDDGKPEDGNMTLLVPQIWSGAFASHIKAEMTLTRKETSTIWKWAWLGLSVAQTAVLIGLEADLLSSVIQFFSLGYGSAQTAGTQAIVLVYLSLFFMGQLFFLGLVIDSVLARNTIQVLATVGFNLLLFLYSIVQIIQIERLVRYLDLCLGRAAPANSDEISYLQFCVQSTVTTEQAFQTLSRNMGVRISVAVLAGVFLVVGALVAFKVFQEFGWSIWRSQGADIKKRRVLQRYHLFILLIKLNAFFFIGVASQYVAGNLFMERAINLRNRTPINENVAASVAPLVIVTVVFFVAFYTSAFYGIKRTSYTIMSIFGLLILGISFSSLTLLPAEVGVYIYFWVQVQTDPLFQFTRIFFGMFCGMNVGINLLTFVAAFRLVLSFRGDNARENLVQARASARAGWRGLSRRSDSCMTFDGETGPGHTEGLTSPHATLGTLLMVAESEAPPVQTPAPGKHGRFEVVLD